ncbi:hypothetical protein FVE85_8301 [Porphyridium purpureum]|uniref:Uncharacterized protein n=1 Tax=Porphyridium purpureum TaxID=35688 RepID=A0A5J4YK63_PORPP|nr:hypothetical protein FVE85_8301 [Porphyridium purpureum]|eukprot:POR4848..scf244_11
MVRSTMRSAALVLVVVLLGTAALCVRAQVGPGQRSACSQREIQCYAGTEDDCSEYSCVAYVPLETDSFEVPPVNPTGSCSVDSGDLATCKSPDCTDRLCPIVAIANDWVVNLFSQSVVSDTSCANVCAQAGKVCNQEASAVLSSPAMMISVLAQNFSPLSCEDVGGSFAPAEAAGLFEGGCAFIENAAAYTCESVIPNTTPSEFISVCCCGPNCPLEVNPGQRMAEVAGSQEVSVAENRPRFPRMGMREFLSKLSGRGARTSFPGH